MLAFGAVMSATLWVTRRPVQGPGWLLLRSLVPAWRFFEDVESTADLHYRFASPETGAYGEWQLATVSPARGSLALLLNARGNLALAEQSLVEQLLAEIDGCPIERVTSLVPYCLAQELVKARLRERGVAAHVPYQLRLDADGIEVFVSEEHRS